MINCFEKVTINDFITHKIKVHPTTFAEIPDDIFKCIDYKLVEIKKTIPERALEVFQIFLNLSIFLKISVNSLTSFFTSYNPAISSNDVFFAFVILKFVLKILLI